MSIVVTGLIAFLACERVESPVAVKDPSPAFAVSPSAPLFYQSDSTAKVTIRVYDNAGTLRFQNADFLNSDGFSLSDRDPSVRVRDVNDLRIMRLGNNGTGTSTLPVGWMYWGGAAVSLTDWVGPFAEGGTPGDSTPAPPDDSTPPPPPPPPPGDTTTAGPVAWSSDWSTAIGQTLTALQDGGKWASYQGSGLSTQAAVVPSTGLGFPSVNVAKFSYDGLSHKNFQVISSISASDAVPAVGQYWYLRLYYRNAVGDGQDLGEAHWLQAHDITSWEFKHASPGGGKTKLRVVLDAGGRVVSNFYDNNFFVTINTNVTYRVEMQIHRITASTGKLQLRVYDTSNKLLFDNNNFVSYDNQGSLNVRNPTMPVNDAAFTNFDLGNNDPDRSGVGDFYVGSVATHVSSSATDWIGPAR